MTAVEEKIPLALLVMVERLEFELVVVLNPGPLHAYDSFVVNPYLQLKYLSKLLFIIYFKLYQLYNVP